MKQKDDAHQGDDEALLKQLATEIVDGPLDQVAPVVDRRQDNASGEALLDLRDLGLDACDGGEGILAKPHDHDAAHRVAPPV